MPEQSSSLDLPFKFELVTKLLSFTSGFFYGCSPLLKGPFWAEGILFGGALEGSSALLFSLVRGLKNISAGELPTSEQCRSFSFWKQHYKNNKSTYFKWGVTAFILLTLECAALSSENEEPTTAIGLLMTLSIHGLNDLISFLAEANRKENKKENTEVLPTTVSESTPLLRQ